MTNGKINFVPSVWVKCMYDDKICLGRTFYGKSKSNKAPEMISLISETGEHQHLPFSLVRKVVILKILTVAEFENDFSVKSKVNDSGGLKKLGSQLAKYQQRTSMS
jgi:hypothetical protein